MYNSISKCAKDINISTSSKNIKECLNSRKSYKDYTFVHALS